MREIDELYADSGEPVKQSGGVSRGTALKVGGFGLVGALAAFLPGRASAHAKKVAANSICQGTASFCLDNCTGTVCGGGTAVKCGTNDCYCLRIYYGRLLGIHAPVGACAQSGTGGTGTDFDWDGDNFGFCGTPGQKDCPGNCKPSLCPGPNCPSACNDNPCWGPKGCPSGTFCADPYSLDGCSTRIGSTPGGPWPVCAPFCGQSSPDLKNARG
jgi:hypothetical protein